MPRLAHADREQDALLWGVTTFEVTGIGAATALVTLTDKHTSDAVQGALILSPLVLGTGAGVAAYYGRTDATVPRAVHGALWTGFDLFMVGALVEGAGDDGITAGPWAWSLGAAGALAGAWVGAREVGPGLESNVWFGSANGAFIGAMGGGLALLVRGSHWSKHTRAQVFGWSTVGGLSLGLTTAYVIALTHKDTHVANAAPMFSVSPSLAPLGLTLGGTF